MRMTGLRWLMSWLAASLLALPLAARAPECWTAGWASAQMIPAGDQVLPREWLENATLRQVVRVGLTGPQLRLRLSNVHGTTPLEIGGVTIAPAADNRTARIGNGSFIPVRFDGWTTIVIPAGAEVWTDPVDLPVTAGMDLAVSLYLPEAPNPPTGHPGSRATTHFLPGDHTQAEVLPGANTAPRWLILAGVEVLSAQSRAIVVLGDSITDGFGVQPDTNARWTDALTERLRADPRFAGVAVLNAGIGGNRLRLDGLGPNALARFDRDVLSQPGVSHVIVLEGVNDLGTLTRDAPASEEAHRALVAEMIAVLREMVRRAREAGIVAIGGTILPYGASGYYHPDTRNEADRQAVNDWIRAPGNFDAVVDFDAALGDPADPARLDPRWDSGDGLHPSLAGYRAMAAAVPLEVLKMSPSRPKRCQR